MSFAPSQQRKADFAMAYKELIEYLLCLILLGKLWAIKIFQDLCECQWCWSLITSYIMQHRTNRPGFWSPKEDCGKSLFPHHNSNLTEARWCQSDVYWLQASCFLVSPALERWLLNALLLSTDGLNNNNYGKGWCSVVLPCLPSTCAHGIWGSFSHWQYLYSCPFFQSSIT